MFGKSLLWKMRVLVLCVAAGGLGFYGWQLYGDWQRGGWQEVLVEEEPSYVPPVNWSLIAGVDLVVEIDIAALSESAVWTRLNDVLAEEEALELASLFGPDVLQDVQHVLFSADVEFPAFGDDRVAGVLELFAGDESPSAGGSDKDLLAEVAGPQTAPDSSDLMGLVGGGAVERGGELLHLSYGQALDEAAYRRVVASLGEMAVQEVTEERFGDELGFRVGLISEGGFYVLWMPSRRDVLLSVSRLVLQDAVERWYGRLEAPGFALFEVLSDQPRRLGQVRFWFQVPAALSENLGLFADALQDVAAVGEEAKPPLFGMLDPAFVRAFSSLEGNFLAGDNVSVELRLGFSDSTAASSLAVLLAAAADALAYDFDGSPLVVSGPVAYLQGAYKVVLKSVFSGRALNELAEDLTGKRSGVLSVLPE